MKRHILFTYIYFKCTYKCCAIYISIYITSTGMHFWISMKTVRSSVRTVSGIKGLFVWRSCRSVSKRVEACLLRAAEFPSWLCLVLLSEIMHHHKSKLSAKLLTSLNPSGVVFTAVTRSIVA